MKLDLILIGNQGTVFLEAAWELGTGSGKTSLIKRFLFKDLEASSSLSAF